MSFFTKKRKQKTDLSGQSGAFAGLGHGRTLGEVGRATGGSVDREAHRALGLVDKKIISIVSVQTVFSIRRTDLAHQVRALAQLLEEAALGRVDHKRTRSGRSVGLQTKKQLQFCSGVFFFQPSLGSYLAGQTGTLGEVDGTLFGHGRTAADLGPHGTSGGFGQHRTLESVGAGLWTNKEKTNKQSEPIRERRMAATRYLSGQSGTLGRLGQSRTLVESGRALVGLGQRVVHGTRVALL